jgi:TPR repeat protein
MSNQSVSESWATRGSAPAARLTLLVALFAFFAQGAYAASWKLKAQADLAYRRGDYKTAFQKYMKLAKEKGGDAYAECQLGIMFERGEGQPQDAAQAVKWYQLSAEKGNATAAIDLALILDFGKGVPVNHAEAMRWYRLAADRGDVTAQYNMACNYENGSGTDQDYGQARQWFQRAASQEYAKAQIGLGILYQSGQGVDQDVIDAATLFLIASKTTDPEDAQLAAKNLEAIRQQMSGDDFTKAEHIAAAHLEAVRQRRQEEQQRAEAQREQEEAEAAAVAEVEAASGPTYWSMANQGLQNTLARQQAAIAAARAQQAAELANAQQAAAARAEQAAALARAQQSAATQQVINKAAALGAQRNTSSANPGTLPMALHDECIAAGAKLDPTGAGTWFFFTNRCSQLVVIKEFTQAADGSWHGGEDCRSNGQWVEAYENTAGTARYIAWAQFVNSCSQELFLQWPPDPN